MDFIPRLNEYIKILFNTSCLRALLDDKTDGMCRKGNCESCSSVIHCGEEVAYCPTNVIYLFSRNCWEHRQR